MLFYASRYKAYKEKRSDEKVIKVSCGWTIMTEAEYRVWRKQK